MKHAFNLSDEALVERWSETPRWQYFCGQSYYEERLPCDASTPVKFRRILGEEGVEELLAQTIKLAVDLQLIPKEALASVVVDTPVQEKAVAHPTDAKLLEIARDKLVQAAKQAGIALKQTFCIALTCAVAAKRAADAACGAGGDATNAAVGLSPRVK